MRINPLGHPSEVGGKIETRAGDASSVRIDTKRSLPPQQDGQGKQAARLVQLQKALAEHDITLNYSHDDATNRLVIKMVDDRTGEAIRQIPTEVSLKLSAHIQGQFLDHKV